MRKLISLSMVAGCLAAATVAQAQPAPRAAAPAVKEDALDPSPINPATDPKTDLFIGDWRNAAPRTLYGQFVFRDILTNLAGADPLHPVKKGAVLSNITAVSYATLAPGATAAGRSKAGERQIFYTTGGTGQITVNGKAHEVREGVGFTVTPDFDFRLASTGKAPLTFYVRTEPVPANTPASPDIAVVNRYDNDRRVGAHWVHICNGGPNGMNLCTIAPHTIPQPHSHPGEEAWIMVKGESILSLGKTVVKMTPGQAYRIPPTGLAAHSNLNLSEEPIEMIYMGPAVRGEGPGGAPTGTPQLDYARLDNSPINRAAEQDVDMYMGNWHDAFPRIMHGNLYLRDMLTALQGPDPLHPTRKGAVLTNAEAVSYAMLEPDSSAHRIDGELKGVQQSFVVNSGTGAITVAGKTTQLAPGMAFVITPGLDFKLTATGDKYLTFYVVSEKVAEGVAPKAFAVVDNRARPQTTTAWVDKERPLITRGDGLSQYGAVTQVEIGNMAMSRPYSAAKDVEEIWIATEGETELLFGKGLRKLPAGTAFRIPSTGITAQAKINVSGQPAKFLYMVK